MRSAAAPAAIVLAAVIAACTQGDAGEAPSAVARPSPPAAGSSPLRRLTNVEYLNTLHDLFPSIQLSLPALPDDVPVAGFENAAEAQQASDVRVARYETIANLYAAEATSTLVGTGNIVACNDWGTDSLAGACARSFLETTARRVFRRPLTEAERDRFLTKFAAWKDAVDFPGAVQLTLSTMLQSPQFLYRTEPAPEGAVPGSIVPVGPYALATRLSYFLWESTPDDLLLDAAGRGELASDAQVRAHVDRMLQDDRARRVYWGFHRQWLGLDRIWLDEHAARTAAIDPSWTPATQASASRESELFVENVLAGGGSLADLFGSNRAWIDGEMARVYGLPAPTDPKAWTETTLPEGERAGLFTRAAFLAGFAHRGATSPPVRGNAVQLRLLCQLPVSPPPGVDLSQPTAQPGDGPQTNRMLFETRTKPAMCQACHAGLNGFGFGFENYDAAGHFHTTENGLPVDASGKIHGTDVDGAYTGAIKLSQKLADSATVRRCATERMMRYALGRAPEGVETDTLNALTKAFGESYGNIRALLTAVATAPTFRMRKVEEAAP